MKPFPLETFRDAFSPHFAGSDMDVMFSDMIEVMAGNGDPWEKVHKLRLRFYEFDEEEFDFEDWLINAGYFFLVLKAEIMNDTSADTIARLASWFQEILQGAREDLMEDEIPYLLSFDVMAELLKLHPAASPDGLDAGMEAALDTFLVARQSELLDYQPYTREKAIALVAPALLDAIKVFPGSSGFFLRWIGLLLDMLIVDRVQADEVTGMCVRTLAFRDYQTAATGEQFAWALDRLGSIFDPFVKLTSAVNLAKGHQLRGDQERGLALLKEGFTASFSLPPPKKQVHVSFVMRGLIECLARKTPLFKDVRVAFDEHVANAIATIDELNEQLAKSEDPDADLDGIMESMEMAFVIVSGALDNLGIAGLHAADELAIKQVDKILDEVQEANLSINFKSKNALYLGTMRGPAAARAVHGILEFIVDVLERDVEAIYLDDLYDFYIEHSKNCLELALLHGSDEPLVHLERVFSLVKDKKQLGEDDLDMLRYQTLAAMNHVLSVAWSKHHGVPLLQGYST